jgi:hypothetical protein
MIEEGAEGLRKRSDSQIFELEVRWIFCRTTLHNTYVGGASDESDNDLSQNKVKRFQHGLHI